MTTLLSARQIGDQFDHAHVDELRYLHCALETGLSGTSSMVSMYERGLAELYDMPHALAVSSGTAAVAVAMSALDCQPGDEVLIAPSCPVCTVLPLLALGLRPVFCDVMPDSFGLDVTQLDKSLSSRTRAVIEVPMWGYPTPVAPLREFADAHGLALVLDLAHCHLTRLGGRWLAAYAEIACFSTHEGKFLSTGEGGFVLCKSAAVDARMRAWSRFGNLDGRTPGVNLKLGGLAAAVGVARLEAVHRHRAWRLRHREAILSRLENPHVRELPMPEGGEINGYALLLQTVDSDGRRLVEHQVAQGVPSDVGKYDNQPLYNYPLLAHLRRDCPRAASLLRSLTTVPLHPGLDAGDIDHIVQILNDYRPA